MIDVSKWRETQKAVHATAKEKGWWDEPRPDGAIFALIHSELSECLEYLRNGNQPDDHCPELDGATVELADAAIRIMDYAEHRGFDLQEWMEGVIADGDMLAEEGSDYIPDDDGSALFMIHYAVSAAGDACVRGKHHSKDLLAVVSLAILDMANARGWDIWHAIEVKAAYNKTRPVKHGGKKF